MDIINWIIANWVAILAAAGSVCLAASAITKLTDTPEDDAWVARVYKVIETLAMVTGKAKCLPGEKVPGVTASTKSKTSVLFLPLLLLILTVSCAATLTPKERAQSTGYEVAEAYQDLYQNYVSTNERLTEAGQTMPVELAKSMDALKKSIIAYNDLVIIWVDTNATDTPAGLSTLGADIAGLIADVSASLMSLEDK